MKKYLPLLMLLLLALLGALALASGRSLNTHGAMAAFMGLGLLLFAFLKLIDLPGFVRGFRRYDALAQALPFYAWLYPFLELALGLAYLGGFWPQATNLVMLLLAAVNLLSVVRALRLGLKVNCACLGTALNVPLTSVTVVENGLMAAMAAAMLL